MRSRANVTKKNHKKIGGTKLKITKKPQQFYKFLSRQNTKNQLSETLENIVILRIFSVLTQCLAKEKNLLN
jgi:hypothetical protein